MIVIVGAAELAGLAFLIEWWKDRLMTTDPYVTSDMFIPDADAGALDRAVLALAQRVYTEGDDEGSAELAIGMTYIREAVRNPLPQGGEDSAGVVEQLRALAENATSLADRIERLS